MVGHDRGRRGPGGRQGAAEAGLRRLGVAVVAEQDVEDLALFVDGTVEAAFLLAFAPGQEHPAHEPRRARPPAGARR
jgi:hypothetical protein